RHKIARGLGKKGGPIAVRTCLEKLRSLDAKGCIKLVEEREDAPGVQVLVPSEMPGLIGRGGRPKPPDLEEMDFFNAPQNRRLILEREDGRCFYCLKKDQRFECRVRPCRPQISGRRDVPQRRGLMPPLQQPQG
ncbi:MAG: hypothetical protein ACYSUF_14880, partial [Planctomycetota bacterium]